LKTKKIPNEEGNSEKKREKREGEGIVHM